MSIAEIKLKIIELKNELPMLCDIDYYNACDEIEYYESLLGDKENERWFFNNILKRCRRWKR